MTENDNVDEAGFPLWYRLAQTLGPEVTEDIALKAKHIVRRLEQRGIVLRLAPPENGRCCTHPDPRIRRCCAHPDTGTC